MQSLTEIEEQAIKEIKEEKFREEVEKYKNRIRNKRESWSIRLPFGITITWRK